MFTVLEVRITRLPWRHRGTGRGELDYSVWLNGERLFRSSSYDTNNPGASLQAADKFAKQLQRALGMEECDIQVEPEGA